MKKKTMVVAILAVVGSVWLANDVAASCRRYDAYYTGARNAYQSNQSVTNYNSDNTAVCPWYKRWFGFHNAGCSWNADTCNPGC